MKTKPFEKRWPRRRRQTTGKGIPEIRTHTFVYTEDIANEPGIAGMRVRERYHHDLYRVFPRGTYSEKITHYQNDLTKQCETRCVVTQTRAQRLEER